MTENDIWIKYEKEENRIGYGTFGDVYKIKNKETGYYYALKVIDKDKFNESITLLKKEIEIMKKINTENSVSIKEIFDTKRYFYIIMDLCEYNLEDYIKRREDSITINEIKEILTQLNNCFKIMYKENIIHRDLKPKNILISLKKIDKCLIKLSNYGSSKCLNQLNTNTIGNNRTLLTMAPEVLNDQKELINSKCDIWSLGIIIYYLLFKEYPYNGNNEYKILQDINTNKKLKKCNNEELNDLLNNMLKINVNERISWDDYFNHSFFQNKEITSDNNLEKKSVSYPQFNFNCELHSINVNNYCKTCKKNICNSCLKEHSQHQTISFSEIGLTNEERKKLDDLKQEIENNLNIFSKISNNIENIIKQIKLIKGNEFAYKNDEKNNYKKYYIDLLEMMNDQIKNKTNIELIDLNYIICEYGDIIKDKLNEPIQILNCYEEAKKEYSSLKGKNNEKEIKDNCELYLNDKKIDFCYKYTFKKEGNYIIKIIFENPLNNTNYIFSNCSSLTSLDLSNFYTNNITNMSFMFAHCSSLTSLELSNYNTNKVTNMEYMFNNCSSLTSLNLSSFNTNNVTNMNSMFSNCSSLTSLDLSNFNTNNVIYMNGMFYNCRSLTSLNLSNFNSNNVTNMNQMFSDCSSLKSLKISNFNTNKVRDMSFMFNKCSSLTSLNLSNFNTNNVTNMNSMFCNCFSLISLDLSNFNTNNVIEMNNMFDNINKKCEIKSNDKRINAFCYIY